MSYDEWKTTEPDRDDPCPECGGEGTITIEVVRRGELDHVTEPCPTCRDVDDRDPSEPRLPDSDRTGLPEAPR